MTSKMCDCNQGRFPCTCLPDADVLAVIAEDATERDGLLPSVKKLLPMPKVNAPKTDPVPPVGSELQHADLGKFIDYIWSLKAEREALQQLLNDRDQKLNDLEAEKFALEDQVKGLQELLNAPELHDFAKGVTQEAAHQRDRWGTTHDAGKGPADWFWLIGYLAQKAMTAQMLGNTDKALHHCISTAAALNNWHASIMGANTDMRPGIEPPADNETVCRGDKNLGTACGSCKRCKARDV